MSIVFEVPSSKSISQRALIAAALADGCSEIRGLSRCDDTQVVIDAVRQLGAWVDDSGDPVLVRGSGQFLSGIHPADESFAVPDAAAGAPDANGLPLGPVDCGESAAALRFLIPLFTQSGKRCLFTGRGRLTERPQGPYEKIYNEDGRSFANTGAYIAVQGRLKPGTYTWPGDVSSQFVSGLLFVLPTLDADSEIMLTTPLKSAPYVELTLSVLSLAGIKAELRRDNGSVTGIRVPGRQRYMPFNIDVEADWSSAAPLLAAAMLCGKDAQVRGLNYDSLQADRAILDLLRAFKTSSGLKAIEADISDCPDLGPLLFAAATQAEGTSVFRGTKRLRFKESDRIANMEQQLKKLGCIIRSDEDAVYVTGKTAIKGGVSVSGCGDHRIVMALAVLAITAKKPVTMEGAGAVSKSFPGFFGQLKKLL